MVNINGFILMDSNKSSKYLFQVISDEKGISKPLRSVQIGQKFYNLRWSKRNSPKFYFSRADQFWTVVKRSMDP